MNRRSDATTSQMRRHLPTGMAEVVTAAVAWDECDAIVMVTIVLLVIWVCGTEPGCTKYIGQSPSCVCV